MKNYLLNKIKIEDVRANTLHMRNGHSNIEYTHYSVKLTKSFRGEHPYSEFVNWFKIVSQDVKEAFTEFEEANFDLFLAGNSEPMINTLKTKRILCDVKVVLKFHAQTNEWGGGRIHPLKVYIYISDITEDNHKDIPNSTISRTEFTPINKLQNIDHQKQKYREFSGSYAQDYMNIDDATINDAFEGDSDSYWNID